MLLNSAKETVEQIRLDFSNAFAKASVLVISIHTV